MRGCTCDIYGARLRVEADDGPARRALMRVLHGFPVIEEAEATARLSLRFVSRPRLPPETATPLSQVGEARVLAEGSRLWLTDGWSRLVVDAAAGWGEGEVHPGSWTHERRFHDLFLRVGLLELLRGQGCFPLNATALVGGHGGAALAVAGAGSCPAALAARWVSDGGVCLGDGAMLLRAGADGVTAGAWPALVPSELAPGISPMAMPSEPEGVLGARRPGVAPSALPAICRPGIVLVAVQSPGATRIEPLLPREALAALVPASPLLLTHPGSASAHLEALRRLVAQCRCYRLFYGPELLRRPGAIHDLLPALAPRCS